MANRNRVQIAILDYGMGNLRSVAKALERTGATAIVTSDSETTRTSDGVVLPGVGAFPEAMRNLRRIGHDEVLADVVADGTPTLGICLGMQLLFEESSENEGSKGLGLLPGRVERLHAPGLKVPLIGWSPVNWSKGSCLLDGLEDGCPFYFVHSFAPVPREPADVLARAEYGSDFVCAVEHGSLYGVQFHPEKSSGGGLRLLENFASICAAVGASA